MNLEIVKYLSFGDFKVSKNCFSEYLLIKLDQKKNQENSAHQPKELELVEYALVITFF